jgi:hypothetical protein
MLSNLFRTIDINKRTVNKLSYLIPHLVGSIVFATILVVPPAFGQTDYSDAWLSGGMYSGEDANFDEASQDTISIVAAGVTDDDYSADAVGVETTLTSPNGRTVTGEFDEYGSARVEVTLPWDGSDLGNYRVYTRHQPLCWGNWDGSLIYETRSGGHYFYHWNPDYARCGASRETSFALPVGVSLSCYRKYAEVHAGGAVTASYRVIDNCDCTCKSTTATVVFRRGPFYTPKEFLAVAEPYAYTPVYSKICAHVTTWQEANQCNVCSDFDFPSLDIP